MIFAIERPTPIIWLIIFSATRKWKKTRKTKQRRKLNDHFMARVFVLSKMFAYLTVLAIAVAGFRLRNAFSHFVFIDVLDTDNLRSRSLRGGDPCPPLCPVADAAATDDATAAEFDVVVVVVVVLEAPIPGSAFPKNKSFCKLRQIENGIEKFIIYVHTRKSIQMKIDTPFPPPLNSRMWFFNHLTKVCIFFFPTQVSRVIM